jgi:hypothetical protein
MSTLTTKLSTCWVFIQIFTRCWEHLGLGAILQRSVGKHPQGIHLGSLMTMAPILDVGVPSLSFRLEGVEQVVPYVLGSFLVFKREPRNKWICMEAHWKVFGV